MGIKSFFQRAYDWLAGFGKYLKDLIIDVFTETVKDFIEKMGPTIEEILLEIQSDPGLVTDTARRNAAIKRIKDEAKAAGISAIKTSVISMSIEFILQALKSANRLGENVGE